MTEYGASFTREVAMGEFNVPADATFVSAVEPTNDRSVGDAGWRARQQVAGATFILTTHETPESATFVSPAGTTVLSLHDAQAIQNWLRALPPPVFIDITLMSLSTWAPILRAAVEGEVKCRFIYVEPAEYIRPDPGDYELSEFTAGVGTVPGFAVLADTTNVSPPLVALLGFEGFRFARVLDKLEPPDTRPIIGVPGYQLEFPFYSYEGNRHQIVQNRLQNRISLARANCPFDTFAVLAEIHAYMGESRIQVAPIGTKPHALGAVLFAIARPDVELVYDHPKSSVHPTKGASRTCVYYVSEFVQSDLYSSGVASVA